MDDGMIQVLPYMSLMTRLFSKPIMRKLMDRKYKWKMKYDVELLESDPSNLTSLPERKSPLSMCFMSPT